MYGTLGLWYEYRNNISDIGPTLEEKPKADIHVNLWRDVGYKLNYFDFGILLKDISNVSKIFLYIPTLVKKSQICDLGCSLKESDTLNAVFNELYRINNEFDKYFFVSDINDRTENKKVIHEIDVDSDLSVNIFNISRGNNGTIISFSCELLNRIRNSLSSDYTDSYIRIRIVLDKNSKNIFTSDDNSSDVGFSISHNTTEVTEFRFNERRSYPSNVLARSLSGKQFDIRAIYYFLMRNKKYSLKSQHQNFKKIRFLEPRIWDRYASYGNASGKVLQLNQSMMIYQWRSSVKKDEEGIIDFSAYASFENNSLKILSYIIVLLAFGGVGGSVLNIMIDFMKIRSEGNSALGVILLAYNPQKVTDKIHDTAIDLRMNLISFFILMFIALCPVLWFFIKKSVSEFFHKYVSNRIQNTFYN